MVRSLQRQAGLVVGKDLQLDLVGGVGQELSRLSERAVLHAGAVDGQDVIAHVQRSAPAGGERLSALPLWNVTFMSFKVKISQFPFTPPPPPPPQNTGVL